VVKLLIAPLLATSMEGQARLLAKLAGSLGWATELKANISPADTRDPANKAFIWMTLFATDIIGPVGIQWYNIKQAPDKEGIFYITVEGIPQQSQVLHTPLARFEYVAVSKFAAECLRHAGLGVVDVVHHAIDVDECAKAKAKATKWKKRFEVEFGKRCKFIYVGRHDPRKGLGILSKAIDLLNRRHQHEFVVLLHTDLPACKQFPQPNVFFVGRFGQERREDLFAKIAACDFMVFPTQCEGFGLPLLEANAVGIPVVHCWMPPLCEFSSEKFNFVYDYEARELVKNIYRQHWVFHKFTPEVLAGTMELALDTWKRDPKQLKEYKAQAEEHVKRWDYRKVYPKLLEYVGVTHARQVGA